MKKGIAAWIWIVATIMLGILIFAFGSRMIIKMLQARQKQTVLEQYNDLYNKLRNNCLGGTGQQYFYDVALPEVLRAFYVANDSSEQPPDLVSVFITDSKSNVGKYFCMQFADESTLPRCADIGCYTNMTYVGTPSQKPDLAAQIARALAGITGSTPIHKYHLFINKTSRYIVTVKATKIIESKPSRATTSKPSTTSTTSSTTTTTIPYQSKWPKVVAQFHSNEDISGGCSNIPYSDCVNSFLNNPIPGIDGIVLSPRHPDSVLKPLIDKAHSLGIAVGMWAEEAPGTTNAMNEVKREANLGIDFIEEDERILCCGMTPSQFNSYKTAAKQINPNIFIGIAEPYQSAISNFLNGGGQPDFISGEWYISPGTNTFQWYVNTAQQKGIKVAYWLDGSTLDQSCTVYNTVSSVWYFNAAGYTNQIKSSLSSCYASSTSSSTVFSTTTTASTTPCSTQDTSSLAQHAVTVCNNYYQQLVNRMGFSHPTSSIEIYTYDQSNGVPAYTAGNKMYFNKWWFNSHPNDDGAIVHEEVHAIMMAPNYVVWIVEGTSEFGRFVFGFTTSWSYPHCDNYNDGPRDKMQCTADFLIWLEGSCGNKIIKNVSNALADNTYSDSIFSTTCGKDLNQLYSDYWASKH